MKDIINKNFKIAALLIVLSLIVFFTLSTNSNSTDYVAQIRYEKVRSIATESNLDFTNKNFETHQKQDLNFMEKAIDQTLQDIEFQVNYATTDTSTYTNNNILSLILIVTIIGISVLFIKKVGQFTSND